MFEVCTDQPPTKTLFFSINGPPRRPSSTNSISPTWSVFAFSISGFILFGLSIRNAGTVQVPNEVRMKGVVGGLIYAVVAFEGDL